MLPDIKNKFFYHDGHWYFNGLEVDDPTTKDEIPIIPVDTRPNFENLTEDENPFFVIHGDTPSLITRVKSFGRAIKSKLLDTPTPEADIKARLAVCAGCEAYNPKGFCNACGCSKNKFTLLTVKARIRFSTCPKGKWDQAVNPPPAT